MPYALHAWFTYSPEPYISCGPCKTTFHRSPQNRNRPLHPKEVLTTKDRLAQPSSWVVSFFLPCDSPWVEERGFGPVVTQLLQLTRPINTSMWSVRSILARGGYNLRGADLPHITPRPSQPAISTFHLRAPPGLQFNQVPSTRPRCWV
jgi:hypothetical protein